MKTYQIINRYTLTPYRAFKRKIWALREMLTLQLFNGKEKYMCIEEIGNNQREILDIWQQYKEMEK
jgi:hypothetical protein